MNWIRRSLKLKITFSIVLIIIFAVTAAVYFSYSVTAINLLADKNHELKESAINESLTISQKFDLVQSMLSTVTNDPRTALSLMRQPLVVSIDETLKNFLVKDFITDLGVTDLDGTVMASTSQDAIGKNYKEKVFFQKAIAGNTSVAHIANFESKEVRYYAYSPVKTNEGRIVGTVYARVLPDILFSNLTTTSLHHAADIIVVDSDGIIIHSVDESNLLKSLWTLYDSEKKDIAKKYALDSADTIIESKEYEITKDKIKSFSGPQIFDFKHKDEKHSEDVIMTITDITGAQPLYLVTEFEKHELISDVATKNAQGIALVGTVFIVAVSFIIITILTHFLKPLKVLQKVMESIGRGNLNQDINIKTKDEFRTLGDTIDVMTKELKKKELIDRAREQQQEKPPDSF